MKQIYILQRWMFAVLFVLSWSAAVYVILSAIRHWKGIDSAIESGDPELRHLGLIHRALTCWIALMLIGLALWLTKMCFVKWKRPQKSLANHGCMGE